ncbi:uncharacterized protein LOC120659255 [Panicum virgatum]|uniref:uncharacterized protein LOC120659255 n=1 Tax=Panicum virgatum TaxID=38727 RepID=UPI0019D62F96|nr:uncharacterized protein LOC120659255 [Panicum virgatum]
MPMKTTRKELRWQSSKISAASPSRLFISSPPSLSRVLSTLSHSTRRRSSIFSSGFCTLRVGGRICGIQEGGRGRRGWGSVETRPRVLSLISHPPTIPGSHRGLEKASAGLKRRGRDEGGSAETRPRGHGCAISESGEGSVGPDGGEMKGAYWIRVQGKETQSTVQCSGSSSLQWCASHGDHCNTSPMVSMFWLGVLGAVSHGRGSTNEILWAIVLPSLLIILFQ